MHRLARTLCISAVATWAASTPAYADAEPATEEPNGEIAGDDGPEEPSSDPDAPSAKGGGTSTGRAEEGGRAPTAKPAPQRPDTGTAEPDKPASSPGESSPAPSPDGARSMPPDPDHGASGDWGVEPSDEVLTRGDAEPWVERAEPEARFDPRLPGGVTSLITGGLLLGGGIGGYMDSEGQGTGGAFAVGGIVGGAAGMLTGAALLGYAAEEGRDIPRRSHRLAAAGQALTGMGFALTTTMMISTLHAAVEGDAFASFVVFGLPIAGSTLVTGSSLWLASLRDREVEGPTRTVMRSPAMAVVGGMMAGAGLAALGSSIYLTADDDVGEDAETSISAIATGVTTTSFGTAMLVYGLSDAEIPDWLSAVAPQPGGASLRGRF